MSPSPLLRDVGSNPITSAHSHMWTLLHLPLPFPEGCRQLKLTQSRNGGGRYTRGDPGNGRPMQCITKHKPRHLLCSFSSFMLIPFHRPLFPNTGVTNNVTNCNNCPLTTWDLTADKYDQLSTSPPAIDKCNLPLIHTPTTTKYRQLRTHTGPPHQMPAMMKGLLGSTTMTGDPSATLTMTAVVAVKMTMGIIAAAAKTMTGTTTAGTTTKATFGITTAAVKITMGKRKAVGNDDGGDDDKPNEDIEMPCCWWIPLATPTRSQPWTSSPSGVPPLLWGMWAHLYCSRQGKWRGTSWEQATIKVVARFCFSYFPRTTIDDSGIPLPMSSDVRAQAQSPKLAQAGPQKPSQARALYMALKGLKILEACTWALDFGSCNCH